MFNLSFAVHIFLPIAAIVYGIVCLSRAGSTDDADLCWTDTLMDFEDDTAQDSELAHVTRNKVGTDCLRVTTAPSGECRIPVCKAACLLGAAALAVGIIHLVRQSQRDTRCSVHARRCA